MKSLKRRTRRLFIILRLSWSCLRLVASGQKALLPQTIYTSFRQLGGVYVKFLQLLVLRSEFFHVLRDYDIYDVYDKVGVEPIDIREVLSRELDGRMSEIALHSETPFAAGSFGQVYLAEHQGKWVILKVLRPTIINDLKFDLRVLGFFSRCISWFSTGSPIDSKRLHKEFARVTQLETNYALEVDYASMLYERYRGHLNIVIPYTYRELSTAHIICQDYVDGIAGTDLIKLAKSGVDAEQYVAQNLGSNLKQQLVALGSETVASAFLHGTSYGDPHPGNIKFMPGNRIGLIDFGLQAPAPRNTLNYRRVIEQYYKARCGQPDFKGYSRVLMEMYGGDIIRAAYSLDEYYGTGSHRLMDNLVSNIEQLMARQPEQTSRLLKNNKVALMFTSVINKNNRFCLQYNLDGPELIRAGNLFTGMVDSLGVGADQSVMRETYAQALERTKDVVLSGEQEPLPPETAMQILASWFDRVSYRNPQLYRQIRRERPGYV
jgi:serine/threonine protein kinase